MFGRQVTLKLKANSATEPHRRGRAYPEVLKTLSNVIDGTPTVKSFEFASSTLLPVAVSKLM